MILFLIIVFLITRKNVKSSIEKVVETKKKIKYIFYRIKYIFACTQQRHKMTLVNNSY